MTCLFVDFEFEQRQMFCCGFTRGNGDWERVPKVGDARRERALWVIWTVLLKIGSTTARDVGKPFVSVPLFSPCQEQRAGKDKRSLSAGVSYLMPASH